MTHLSLLPFFPPPPSPFLLLPPFSSSRQFCTEYCPETTYRRPASGVLLQGVAREGGADIAETTYFLPASGVSPTFLEFPLPVLVQPDFFRAAGAVGSWASQFNSHREHLVPDLIFEFLPRARRGCGRGTSMISAWTGDPRARELLGLGGTGIIVGWFESYLCKLAPHGTPTNLKSSKFLVTWINAQIFSRSVRALKRIKEGKKGDGRRLGDGRLSERAAGAGVTRFRNHESHCATPKIYSTTVPTSILGQQDHKSAKASLVFPGPQYQD
ncbi:hypothetical protein C8R47DRAFT_1303212 [Mycena vitilis]|nr:hypothetical protein C8R47DRAFT_1078505 [Mycena vitilis]KAJ6468019.1 hypothetical protein C8R47DRAFT_1303212 [Mycena vitilis]